MIDPQSATKLLDSLKNDPIPWASPCFWGDEKKLVLEALDSTWISGGPFIERLERQIADFCGVKHAAAVCNGTASLQVAFMAMGIGPGDEIIVPGFGFMAAVNLALQMGAKPVFAEVDPATWCLTAGDIEKCLSPSTRAIVPIHTYGNVCEMDEILALAKSRSIPIVEDAAESLGSKYRGRQSGSMGTIGSFSFQATKTITTGEGGMVITNDRQLHERMCLFRSHGMLKKRYWHEVPGQNFRLTNLQAALGCAQFDHFEEITEHRRRVHKSYRLNLASNPGVAEQKFHDHVDPILWAMAVQLEPKAYPQGRDAVIEQLAALSIETRPGFYSASQLPIYNCPAMPICDQISRNVISLPTFPLLSDEKIERICRELKSLRR